MKRTLLAFLLTMLIPQAAFAFCGFYVAGGDASLFNDATQVALVRDGTRTVLSMQNSYAGPAESFAMVVPVPEVLNEQSVKTLEKEVFDRLDEMTAPRLVEYWEKNPCDGMRGFGFGARRKFEMAPQAVMASAPAADYGVKIESKFAVGEYDVVVLSAQESTGLDAYLRAEKYNIPKGAEPYLRPYVQGGSYFFVAKVDPARAKFDGERAVLSPLRFEYSTQDFRLPIRLGMINSQGEQDLIVYTIGRNKRYEVANYPNAFIPTNLEMSEDVKDSFGEFYASLFAATLEKHPRAVVTEYSWQFSGCDPCPTTPLGGTEMMALGMMSEQDTQQQDRLGGMFGAPMGDWTITRLHARYAPEDVGEDLVFREAGTVLGGREVAADEGGLLPTTVTQQGVNQFQGRYIIRHRYVGPITCINPKFGRWGGPPGGKLGEAMYSAMSPNTKGSEPIVATGKLGDWVDQGIEELGIDGRTPRPMSPDWFMLIFGYTLTLIVLALVLFILRLICKKSLLVFILITALTSGCILCGLPVGELAFVGLLLGQLAILVEGVMRWFKHRKAAKEAFDTEVP